MTISSSDSSSSSKSSESNKKDEEEQKEEITEGSDDKNVDGNKGDKKKNDTLPLLSTTTRDIRERNMACFDEPWKKYSWGCFGFSVVLIGIVLIATSLQKLESTEYGVEYHPRKKILDDAAKTGGLHTGPPGYEFVKFPSTFVTVDLPDGYCVSRDGLRVAFSVTFQYQITADNLKPCILKYRDFDKWSNVVEAAGTSAVQHTCSEFNISNFQNQRGVIQSRMEDNLRGRLEGTEAKNYTDGIYALAISLQLRNVELPSEYQAAVSEKQAANEDIQLAINQRTQEVTKANTALLAANEQARKILDTAMNDANVTITRALLRAEETLFALETEAAVLGRVQTNLRLNTNGVLSYMANKLYEATPQLKVSALEPAKLSRKDEL